MGLICYGGIHEDTGVTCENALEEGFGEERNIDSWDKVGAAGLNGITMKCLKSKKVRHDETDKDNPNYNIHQDIQSKNNFSSDQLIVMGYKGQLLQAAFEEDKIKTKQTSTVTAQESVGKLFDKPRLTVPSFESLEKPMPQQMIYSLVQSTMRRVHKQKSSPLLLNHQ